MKRSSTSTRNTVAKVAMKTPKRTAKPRSAPLSKNPKELIKLKFARLSGDEKFASQIIKSGVSSIRQIAALPSQALLKRLNGKMTRSEERTLSAVQQHARQMTTHVADKAIIAALANSPNGMWRPDRFGGKRPTLTCHCGCCGSIFSLKAYLFDLLDLLAHYWEVDLTTVEALLLRSFSQIHLFDQQNFRVIKRDLDCEALNAPLPQVRVAVEVLEAYLGQLGVALPSGVTAWKEKFVNGLLRLIAPREVQIAFFRGRPSTEIMTIAKLRAQADLPADFAAALAAWKTKLDTLELNLAGIDEAVGLLSDYAQNFTGFAPGTLRRADQVDVTADDQRLREVTVKISSRPAMPPRGNGLPTIATPCGRRPERP